ncbi:thioesterase II family protein [Kibdelosporangium aridum]|uniref:thioesterase II family protein n=1 Tax=Kibdelosporangium aridum TaxID=2030 RepID=UPI0005267979
MTATTDWFVPGSTDLGPRVFAFPHAGAGSAQLVDLGAAVARHRLSLWSVNLPGRQARLAEPPLDDYRELVDELAAALASVDDGRPFALFGYCGGALLAYGVARELFDRALPLPDALVVASYDAPDIANRPRRIVDLASDALWSYMLDSGGVPEHLAADQRLRRVAEPAIRADLSVLAGYRHEPGPPLPVPITVCFGLEDRSVRRGALLGWRRHTAHSVDLRGLAGGYWLLEDASEELAQVLAGVFADTHTGVTP